MLHAFFARLPDVSTVLFRYYLLGGDTAAPSGLFARLCHAFLVMYRPKKQIILVPSLRFFSILYILSSED